MVGSTDMDSPISICKIRLERDERVFNSSFMCFAYDEDI